MLDTSYYFSVNKYFSMDLRDLRSILYKDQTKVWVMYSNPDHEFDWGKNASKSGNSEEVTTFHGIIYFENGKKSLRISKNWASYGIIFIIRSYFIFQNPVTFSTCIKLSHAFSDSQ